VDIGDQDEIERIYRARYGAFLRVAVAILRDEQLGEEVVHDAFVRALRHTHGFRGQGSREGWLFHIVLNESRRRLSTEQRALLTVQPAVSVDVAATNGHRESGALAVLVAGLPERQRLALFLRHYADLDYQAIAVALGVKPGTVGATLHAAHSALRRELLEVER
jgi:RNA polymerase sigma-70 factor (ECF subfamily)